MVGLIMDICLIVILGIFIWRGIHRGFIATFLAFIGGLVAIIISSKLSNYFSPMIFDKFLRQNLINGLVKAFTVNGAEGISNNLNESLSGMPEFIRQMVGENLSTFLTDMEDGINAGMEAAATGFVDTTLKPMVNSLLFMVIFLIFVVILNAVIKFLIGLIGNMRGVPVVGHVNGVLGGVVGFLQGILVIYILLVLVGLFISLTANESSFLNMDVINQTFLTKIFYFHNPFYQPITFSSTASMIWVSLPKPNGNLIS